MPPMEVEMKLKAMLASRIFWAALVGLLMVVVRSFVPHFPLDGEALTQILYLIGAYIFGEAVEGGSAQPVRALEILKSRKFWASLVGAGFVALQAYHPGLALDETMVEQFVWVIVVFVTGTGITDRMAKDDGAGRFTPSGGSAGMEAGGHVDPTTG